MTYIQTWSVYCAFVTIGGGLLIAKRLLNEEKREPRDALLLSFNMLVITEGKELTVKEYKQLLEKHGFSDFQAKQLESSSGLDAILCTKVYVDWLRRIPLKVPAISAKIIY